jgi:hypothetical protein
MVVREILDELSAIEKAISAAMRHSALGQYQDVHSKLASALRRAGKTKQRIRACCQPLPVATKYTPKPTGRTAA